MINALIGQKGQQGQRFLEDGRRIPVTMVRVPVLPVVEVRTQEKNGYSALTVALGQKKRANKQEVGQVKGAGITTAPRFLREIRITEETTVDQLPKVGESIKAADVLQPGDIVDVIGTSKGKGFAGVVKRHNFKGGPRTHGQSDRERAPGSIGQTTTPGRVYKGKRMAGRMGSDRVTIKNLLVVDVTEDMVLLKGVVPGIPNSIITIKKVGAMKKFVPLHITADTQPEAVEEVPLTAEQPVEEVKVEEAAQPESVEAPAAPEETKTEETNEEKTEEVVTEGENNA